MQNQLMLQMLMHHGSIATNGLLTQIQNVSLLQALADISLTLHAGPFSVPTLKAEGL